jgi:flagellar biosynthesis protein FliQ
MDSTRSSRLAKQGLYLLLMVSAPVLLTVLAVASS